MKGDVDTWLCEDGWEGVYMGLDGMRKIREGRVMVGRKGWRRKG